MSNIYAKMNKFQEAYDNQDNPDYYDEYQSAEEQALEAETDFQERLIIEDDGCSLGIDALAEYLKNYLEEGTDDVDFMLDWKAIISSTFHAPWENRHQPLNRQIAKAIRFKALQMAKEVLR